jgi:hypothetical protein
MALSRFKISKTIAITPIMIEYLIISDTTRLAKLPCGCVAFGFVKLPIRNAMLNTMRETTQYQQDRGYKFRQPYLVMQSSSRSAFLTRTPVLVVSAEVAILSATGNLAGKEDSPTVPRHIRVIKVCTIYKEAHADGFLRNGKVRHRRWSDAGHTFKN